MDSSFAESMNAQVLTTRTSASSARDVISMPRCNTLPSMISASTRFFAQPRLIMPTFGRCEGTAEADSSRCPQEIAAGPADNFMPSSVDRYVFVALFQRLAVFHDLNSVGIKNANGDVFAAKFHRSV